MERGGFMLNFGIKVLEATPEVRMVLQVLKIISMVGVAVFGAIIVVSVCIRAFTEERQKSTITGLDRALKKVIKTDGVRGFKRYIIQTGIQDRFHDLPITPATYILLMLLFGAIIGAGTEVLFGKYFIFGFIAGFIGLDALMRVMNSQDNREIQKDVFMLLMNLRVQLEANVFIVDALMSCEPLIKNKRFKKAIDELINDFGNQNVSNLDAIEAFGNKFKNINVMNLKIFLQNYQLYGISDKYLEDMMSQVNSMSEAEGMAEENDLDQKMGLASLVFFALMFFLMMFGMMQVMTMQGIFG